MATGRATDGCCHVRAHADRTEEPAGEWARAVAVAAQDVQDPPRISKVVLLPTADSFNSMYYVDATAEAGDDNAVAGTRREGVEGSGHTVVLLKATRDIGEGDEVRMASGSAYFDKFIRDNPEGA